ncbi:WhiB family transcriptional regulator [Streptomyces sp. NPDC014892]|uniref:WhiB family transcriptional regulator n=1 Tax=Streptomyces sp. NPDC014892 TaxID=3364930 RepID=UPI0036F7DE1D
MTTKWPAVLVEPSFVKAAEGALQCVADPEAFHQGGTTSEDAEELCRGCGCLAACREYALANRELSGVWGGWTQQQRDAERARREVGAA